MRHISCITCQQQPQPRTIPWPPNSPLCTVRWFAKNKPKNQNQNKILKINKTSLKMGTNTQRLTNKQMVTASQPIGLGAELVNMGN